MIGPQSQAVAAQVWIAANPVDMRKSFDGLAEIVRSFLGHDPLSGNLFVFRNKTSQRLKILWWDRNGLTIYYKRLERGEFRFPAMSDRATSIEGTQLLRLLEGLEIVGRKAM